MRVRWWITVILFLTWLMSYIDRSLMPMALPFVGAELDLKPTLLGVVSSAFFLGYGFMQIPGGLFADRWGPRRMITIGVTLWSVFSILTGVARNVATLVAVRVLFGLGEGVHPPAAFKALSAWFSSAERARANGVVMSSNVIGPIIAPIVFAAVAGALGWRGTFVLVSVPGFVVAALVYWYLRDTPAEHPKVTRAELDEIVRDQRTGERIRLSELLRYKSLWQLFFVYFTWDATWWGFQAWLPTYLYSERGFTLIKTGAVAAFPFMAGFVGMLLSAWVSDKTGRRKAILISVLLGNGLFMLLTATAQNATAAVVYLIATGFFLPAIQGPFWSLPMDLLPGRVMGYATGFINTGGQLAGITAPIVIGALVEMTGTFKAGFMFMAISAVVSAILLAALRDPGRSRREASLTTC